MVMQRSERGELGGRGTLAGPLSPSSSECLPHFSVLREKEEERRRRAEPSRSLTIHHCQIGAELGRARRSNQQRGSGQSGLSSGRYGRHVSAVREFPKFWDKYVE